MDKEMRLMKVTHRAHALISEDRSVVILRGEDGSFQFHWSSPDEENGRVTITTKIALSEEAAFKSFSLFAELTCHIANEEEAGK